MKPISTRNLAIACVVVLVACGLEATWTRTYHPDGWEHVQIRGAAQQPDGGVLLFVSLANYGDADNSTDLLTGRPHGRCGCGDGRFPRSPKSATRASSRFPTRWLPGGSVPPFGHRPCEGVRARPSRWHGPEIPTCPF